MCLTSRNSQLPCSMRIFSCPQLTKRKCQFQSEGKCVLYCQLFSSLSTWRKTFHTANSIHCIFALRSFWAMKILRYVPCIVELQQKKLHFRLSCLHELLCNTSQTWIITWGQWSRVRVLFNIVDGLLLSRQTAPIRRLLPIGILLENTWLDHELC